jgi:DNA-binding YbaB/EbfC family protein
MADRAIDVGLRAEIANDSPMTEKAGKPVSESAPDMRGLFTQAQQAQRRLLAAQEEIARTEVSGSSGGGLVTARVTGTGELVALSIDPRVLVSGPPAETAEAIADLVLAAVRKATQGAERVRRQAVGPLASSVAGLGVPGLVP